MPIPYSRRRQLLLEKKCQLIPALQNQISLRNVSEASKLPLPAQETLARVLERGVNKRQLALKILRRQPSLTEDELLGALDENPIPVEAPESGNSSAHLAQPDACQQESPQVKRVAPLVALLLDYRLHENPIVAEIVASAEFMAGVLDVVLALEQVREPRGSETETVTLALCAVAAQLVDEINALLERNYAHKMAVLQMEKLAWGGFSRGTTWFSPWIKKTGRLSKITQHCSSLGWAV